MSLFAVLSLGTSSLAYELLLTRAFSISHGSHLTFMAVSIAMLGFGASGTVYSLTAARWGRDGTAFPGVCLLCSASTIGSFLLLPLIPLDYLRFPVDPRQFPYLVAALALLSLPFFFAGLGSCLAYVRFPAASGGAPSPAW